MFVQDSKVYVVEYTRKEKRILQIKWNWQDALDYRHELLLDPNAKDEGTGVSIFVYIDHTHSTDRPVDEYLVNFRINRRFGACSFLTEEEAIALREELFIVFNNVRLADNERFQQWIGYQDFSDQDRLRLTEFNSILKRVPANGTNEG